MSHRNLSHRSLLVLVTCITTLCVLAFGMRLPDLSRPNRPKPKPRAYIEEQFKKSLENVAKKSLDHSQTAELTQPCQPATSIVYRTEYPRAFDCAAASPLFSPLSRAPPALSV
jgi:hypothetical protein